MTMTQHVNNNVLSIQLKFDCQKFGSFNERLGKLCSFFGDVIAKCLNM